MTIRRYEPGDLEEMNRWYAARALALVTAGQLPTVGFIVPGVAAGFLYRTDSSLGFLDGFISNPEAPAHRRAAALLEIGACLEQAFTGKHLLVYTAHNGIARWSREHDFAARGSHTLFVKSKEA